MTAENQEVSDLLARGLRISNENGSAGPFNGMAEARKAMKRLDWKPPPREEKPLRLGVSSHSS